MKLIQLNCWGGKLGTALTRLMDDEQPDFACLQEAYLIEDRPGSVLSAPEKFLNIKTWPHHNNAPVFGIRYMHGIYDLCNCVISKIRPINESTVYTRGIYNPDLDSLTDDYNVRNFAHSEYLVNGNKLHIISHHGHHEAGSKKGSTENTEAMELIGSYVDKLEGEVILAGDMNIDINSKSLQPIESRLRNLCKEFEIKSTRNKLAKRPNEVIDYVFVSKGVKVDNFAASEEIVSDHAALILEFNL